MTRAERSSALARRIADARRRSANLRAWTPYLVGSVALIFTFLAWAYVRQTTAENDRLRADSAAQRAIDAINDLLAAKVGLLRAGAGLFAASDSVSHHDFKAFVDRLQLRANYPGTLGIGFSLRIRPEEIPQVMQAQQAQGVSGLRIWPEGEREEYHAIIYLEPLDNLNRTAIGYDMHSEATRAAAMDSARDQGDVIASGKVELVQERFLKSAHQAGFLLYAPVYSGGGVPASVAERRDKLVGFVYMPLRADDLLAGIFANEPAPLLDLQVYDSGAPDPARLMHDSRRMRGADGEGDAARAQFTRTLPIPGRDWTLGFTTRPLFIRTSGGYLAWFVLASGIALSALLFTVSMLQRRAETWAARSARQLGQSESRLRESEDRFRVTFNQAAAGMMIVDIDGRFLSVNQRMCEITGYSDDELQKLTFGEITHPEDRPHEMELTRRVLSGEVDSYTLEKRYIRKDGRVVWVSLSRSAVRDDEGRVRYAVGVAQDITERRRAETDLIRHREHLEAIVADRTVELEQSHQRLRQSERMASLGTLSTGLGHDMGNLLLPIRLRLSTMEGKGLSPEFRDDLEAIRKSTEYLQQLANGLRLLALDPDDSRASEEATNLRSWWADAVPLLRNALPRGAELFCEFPQASSAGVRLPRHMLTQMVFNLVQNAGDAIRTAGASDRPGRVTVWMRHEPGERMMQIGVADNGPGMTAEVRQRCLEPFFTTKRRGISTGLGLALVHGIVQKAGGSIDIQSEPGQGATFSIGLPAAGTDSEEMQSRPQLVAVVDVGDPRSQAYVSSVLESLDFEICDEASRESRANLWVVDEAAVTTRGEQIARFVSDGHNRRVLVFGERPQDLVDHERVRNLPAMFKPTVIWQTARDLARELSMSS